MDWTTLLAAFVAVAGLVVALISTAAARRSAASAQSATEFAKEALRVQLLERRFALLTTVTNFLDEVVGQEAKAHRKDSIHRFARDTRITKYLCGADAEEFVLKVRRTANDLEEAHWEFEKTGRQADSKAEQTYKKLSGELAGQLDEAPKVFDSYLKGWK